MHAAWRLRGGINNGHQITSARELAERGSDLGSAATWLCDLDRLLPHSGPQFPCL